MTGENVGHRLRLREFFWKSQESQRAAAMRKAPASTKSSKTMGTSAVRILAELATGPRHASFDLPAYSPWRLSLFRCVCRPVGALVCPRRRHTLPPPPFALPPNRFPNISCRHQSSHTSAWRLWRLASEWWWVSHIMALGCLKQRSRGLHIVLGPFHSELVAGDAFSGT